MQRSDVVSEGRAHVLLAAAFVGAPKVYEAYSRFDAPLRSFTDLESLENSIQQERKLAPFINLVLHYPDSHGEVIKRKIDLVPAKCNGGTWRETLEGWGLIQLQLKYQGDAGVECRVAVNTQKRAQAWEPTYPNFGPADAWNWKAVERECRRLIRVLRNGI